MPTPMSPAHPPSEAELLAEAIEAFRAGETPVRAVRSLSDLSWPAQAALAEAWPSFALAVRRRITRQMAKLPQEKIELTFGRALRVALADESAEVRRLAVGALWDDEGGDVAERLLELVRSEPSPAVRAEAVRVLGAFARRAAVDELDEALSERLRTDLFGMATDDGEAPEVRRSALISGAAFGGPAIGGVIDRSRDSDDADDQVAAVMAMGRTVESAWLPTLIAELENDDTEVRREAVHSLGLIGDPRALEEIAAAASDRDPTVRSTAIEALGQIGGQGAAKALRALEEDADETDLELIRTALADATGGVLTI